MTVLVEFDVIGIPYPQGSKAAFNAKNGKAMLKEQGGASHAAWRNAVSEKAREVAGRALCNIAEPYDGPLALDVLFRFQMPKTRPKWMRERGWAPKTTAPDSDKLVRLICDSLQASGLVVDDARFYDVHARKIEVATGWTGAHITITREDNVVATTRGAA